MLNTRYTYTTYMPKYAKYALLLRTYFYVHQIDDKRLNVL
jgi:hypothetical protein